MNMTMTVSRYLAKTYIINTALFLLAFLSVIYLVDTLELIRRASKSQDVPITLVLQMGLLKLPEVGQQLFPFAVLFSAMFTFWQLNRRSELIVLRSAGFSVWQFIAPVVVMALVIGVLQTGIINPLGSLLVGKYQQLESRYLDRQDSQIAIFQEGLWLRQSMDGEIAKADDTGQNGYVILHAKRVQQPDWTLRNVTVFYFGRNDTFLRRLDAETARLEPGFWIFENARSHQEGGEAKQEPQVRLDTKLTVPDIEESFSSPETMSFWQLPTHIETLEETGFDASRLRVYYHALLAQPLFLAAMILLAATVSMRPPRIGGSLGLFMIGVFIGFFVFFMSSYLQALGASQQLPAALAAWSPALICMLLGLSVIMGLEDG